MKNIKICARCDCVVDENSIDTNDKYYEPDYCENCGSYTLLSSKDIEKFNKYKHKYILYIPKKYNSKVSETYIAFFKNLNKSGFVVLEIPNIDITTFCKLDEIYDLDSNLYDTKRKECKIELCKQKLLQLENKI